MRKSKKLMSALGWLGRERVGDCSPENLFKALNARGVTAVQVYALMEDYFSLEWNGRIWIPKRWPFWFSQAVEVAQELDWAAYKAKKTEN